MLHSALDGQYALVIDARSQREYAEDHLPCAVNLPVVDNEEYAEVGTTHRTDTHRAYLIGVSYALRNISHSIDDLVARYPKDARMLVYCFRGGKRSKLWFDALSTIGYRVDRLPGGWKAYRAWVRDQLTELPRKFRYHVLCGPTGCGKTRLLSALGVGRRPGSRPRGFGTAPRLADRRHSRRRAAHSEVVRFAARRKASTLRSRAPDLG